MIYTVRLILQALVGDGKGWRMDFNDLDAVWNATWEQVKQYDGYDLNQVDAFFSRLHPQAASKGFLMLTADSSFIKGWVEQHYIAGIKQALKDLSGVPFTVLVEADEPSTPAAVAPAPAPVQEAEPARESSPQSRPEPEFQPPKEERKEESQSHHDDRTDGFPGATSSYRFENFVIGDSNRMAYSMAVAVAETPGKAHLNPLFIYGKSGLGKTHLMCAIQNYIADAMPTLRTVYVDSAEFLSDYTEASAAHDVEKSSFKHFKQKYEEADVLLIDDIQYFQGKKQTLDTVFQIFNKFIKQGKQIVLSADRAPKNIDIDERYKTRFNSGGTFDIQPPEIETKIGIVKSFIEECEATEGGESLGIPDEIVNYIAEASGSNIRELKSAVTKVIYQMTYFDEPVISLDEVKRLLENHFSGGASRRITVADIQREAESFYKVSHADLVGKKRTRNIVYARQVAVYLCRQMLDMTYADIGKKFGDKDYTTMLYSCSNVEEKMKENREMREEVETLRQIILEA